MQQIFQTAARYPTAIPSRNEFPPDEREAYDYHERRLEGWSDSGHTVDGQPYGVPQFRAMLLAPAVAAAISGPQGLGLATRKHEDEPGYHSKADHEMVDLVLSFDAGYWVLVPWHVEAAVIAGVRLDCIEALAAHEESALTPDESLVVRFVRAVRDGAMTDDLWFAMHSRLGSDAGVVNFVALVLGLMWHLGFCSALGVPEMGHDELATILREFRDGTRTVADAKARRARVSAARQLGDRTDSYSL